MRKTSIMNQNELVLACENEMLNTTETSLDGKKKITYDKKFTLFTISLVIICLLLLVVISNSCYFYYTRDWIEKKHALLDFI